jgi:hypothetical protein
LVLGGGDEVGACGFDAGGDVVIGNLIFLRMSVP